MLYPPNRVLRFGGDGSRRQVESGSRREWHELPLDIAEMVADERGEQGKRMKIGRVFQAFSPLVCDIGT